MDKFSKKSSKALIMRGLFYLIAGIVAFFLNLEQGGQAIPLISILCILSGGAIIISSLGHKKKEQIWYYTLAWGLIEFTFGVYLSAFEPDYEFFLNLVSILAILIALFSIVFSFNAKKKQNYFYLVAIINGAWGFALSNFTTMLLPFIGLFLIGFLIIDGLFAIYGGLLYQSVQEKIHRRKSA